MKSVLLFTLLLPFSLSARAEEPVGQGAATGFAYPSIKSGGINVTGDAAKVLWDILAEAPEEYAGGVNEDWRRTGKHIQCSRFSNAADRTKLTYACWTYFDSKGEANVVHPAHRERP